MRSWRTRRFSLPLLAALLLAPLAAAAPPSYAPGVLHPLTSVEQFRTLFQQDKGVPRVLLLVSPT